MQIKPYPSNAKKHPVEQVEKIAASIREFGMHQPIVVDKEGVIIIGHGRFEALKMLDWSEDEIQAVVKVADLTEEQAKAYRLADNKLNESDWDKSLVLEDLKTLSDPMIELTGFDRALFITNSEKDDDVPPIPTEVQSEFGDLYEFAGHRVLCGDARRQECWDRLMDGRKADTFITDPPYNVDYVGKTEDALTIENDAMSDEEYYNLLVSTFTYAHQSLKPGGAFYIWHADSKALTVRQAVFGVGLVVRQCLIWVKNTMVLGRQDYQWKHEPCLYGWKDGASHLWNADRKQTTVLTFDKPSRSEEHPTMKPVELISYQITNNTKGEDIVIDPFLGSGTAVIAAHKTGRICYGMELDPKYTDTVINRYVSYTGNNNIIKNGTPIVWNTKS